MASLNYPKHDKIKFHYQSGQFEGIKRHISKRAFRSLRKCRYDVIMAIKSAKPTEDHAVYEYPQKRS